MSSLDPYELEVLEAYESGKLEQVASKAELLRLRTAARATAIKDRRVNIRLSSIDFLDIQARALAEGVPYQTLIASVLHRYVTGRLAEKAKPLAPENEAPALPRPSSRRRRAAAAPR
jgi:predicted DNA binding CopG/RHH family protein